MMSLPRKLVARKLVAIVALALAAISVPSAQQAGRETPPAAIDFVVVAKDGQPVSDLRADEVSLRVDGKVRPIKSLEFVKFAATGAQSTAPGVAPAFATNAAVETPRAIVLVVDDESMPIGQERKLREAIDQFAAGLPASDRVALVTVPNGGIKVDLTSDRERLRRGVAEITPISPTVHPSCRARTTLLTLRGTFETIARASNGQPIVVAFFSASMEGPSQMERIEKPNAQTGTGGLSTAAGACYLQAEDFKMVGEAAAQARALLYVIHPDYNPTPATVGIENLRGVTGAPLFHLTSTGPEAGLPRIVRETPGYWVATFDIEPGERLDNTHILGVRVSRRDVDVRSRPTLVYSKARPAAADAAPAFTSAFDVLKSGRIFREVSLRAAASPTMGPNGALNLVTLFEPTDPSTVLASAAAALFDEQGRGIAYWTGTAKDLSTWPAVVGMVAPAGRYRLRVAAIDGSGKYGVVEAAVNAELVPAGPLKLGGLSLGLSRSAGFLPRLQFSTEASALVHLEVYGGAAGMPVSVVFEVSETTDGPPLFRVPGVLSATAEEGRFSATGTVTVGILPPGDYVIRAIVGVQGQSAGRVIRTLRKVG
ncbi:MAG TPA: hypothetical protein VN700_04200 [Vicinamibacterales bacterium]|nr:hypothetical protein [Vicinamibacterales bacterium]